MAGLEIDNDWDVTVETSKVRWERKVNQRCQVVEWVWHSSRKHEWSAWSEPLGAGRKRTLGGSNGIISSRQAVSELERFFHG